MSEERRWAGAELSEFAAPEYRRDGLIHKWRFEGMALNKHTNALLLDKTRTQGGAKLVHARQMGAGRCGYRRGMLRTAQTTGLSRKTEMGGDQR